MKMKFLFLFSLSFFLMQLLPVWGQKAIVFPVKTAKKVIPEVSKVTKASSLSSQATKQTITSGEKISTIGLSAAATAMLFQSGVNISLENFGNSVEDLQILSQLLQREIEVSNLRLKLQTDRLSALKQIAPMPGSSFQAVNGGVSFSGTVFQVQYKGKKEVFGVLPSHALAITPGDAYSLKQKTTVIVYKDGKRLEIPVQIVQISSPQFLDLALLKFPEYALSVLSPISLAQKPVQEKDILYSPSLPDAGLPFIDGRIVTEVNPVFLRTSIPVAKEERAGLCGSPVLNRDHEIVGIHTGSTKSADFFGSGDVAYVTSVNGLNSLVEAYFNGGNAKVPFIVNGEKVAELNINEYIKSFSLLDEEGNSLWNQKVEGRFSESLFNKLLQEYPQSYFLVLRTGRVSWDRTGSFLVEDKVHGVLRNVHFYDLQKQKALTNGEFTNMGGTL